MKTLHCDKNIPDIQKHTPHTKTHPRCRGPSKRLSKRKPTDNASWGGAPTKRLSKRKPTDNTSWGGAQQKGFRKESRRTTQAGEGPQQKGFRKESRRITCKLGWTQQSEVHFNVIESTGIPANQKVLYIKEAQRGFLISNHLCAIILEFMSYPVHRL